MQTVDIPENIMYSESIKTEGVGKGVTPCPRSGLCLRDLFVISVPFHYKILKKKFLLERLNQGVPLKSIVSQVLMEKKSVIIKILSKNQ